MRKWGTPVCFLCFKQVRAQTRTRRERSVSENTGVHHNGQLARNDSMWVYSHEYTCTRTFVSPLPCQHGPLTPLYVFFLLPGVSLSPFMMLTQRGWVRTMHVYCLISSTFGLAFVLQCMLLHVQEWRNHTCQSWRPILSQYESTCDIGQCSLELLCQSVSLMPWLLDSSLLLYCSLFCSNEWPLLALRSCSHGGFVLKKTDQSFSFSQLFACFDMVFSDWLVCP